MHVTTDQTNPILPFTEGQQELSDVQDHLLAPVFSQNTAVIGRYMGGMGRGRKSVTETRHKLPSFVFSCCQWSQKDSSPAWVCIYNYKSDAFPEEQSSWSRLRVKVEGKREIFQKMQSPRALPGWIQQGRQEHRASLSSAVQHPL